MKFKFIGSFSSISIAGHCVSADENGVVDIPDEIWAQRDPGSIPPLEAIHERDFEAEALAEKEAADALAAKEAAEAAEAALKAEEANAAANAKISRKK